MKRTLSLALASLLVVVLVSVRFWEKKAARRPAEARRAMVDVVEVSAVVDAVDAARRTVTLDGATRSGQVKAPAKIEPATRSGRRSIESVALFAELARSLPSRVRGVESMAW